LTFGAALLLLLLFEASPPSEEEEEEEFDCSGSKTALNRVVFDDKEEEEECEYNHPFLLNLSASSFLSLRSSERRRPREEEDAKQTDDDVAFRGEKRRGLLPLEEEEEAQPPLVVVVVAKPWHRRAHEEEEEEDKALLDFERPPPRLFQDGVVGVVADIILFVVFPVYPDKFEADYKKKIFFSKSVSLCQRRERETSFLLSLLSLADALFFSLLGRLRVCPFFFVLSLSLSLNARRTLCAFFSSFRGQNYERKCETLNNCEKKRSRRNLRKEKPTDCELFRHLEKERERERNIARARKSRKKKKVFYIRPSGFVLLFLLLLWKERKEDLDL